MWFSRSAWALRHIVINWKDRRDRETPTVWLPDYFCNQSTAPMREAGARLTFYPVDQRLLPDWPELAAMAKTGAPDLMIFVHYFGAAFDTRDAARFCREHGAELIEDASHVLVPHGEIGSAGDHVFYSPYKFLAVPDAGLLLSHNELSSIEPSFDHPPPSFLWLTKRLAQKSAPGLAGRLGARPPTHDQDPAFQSLAPQAALSPLARRLMTRAIPRLPALPDDRARRASRWRQELGAQNLALRPLFEDVRREGPAPYRFVAVADDADTARRAYDGLITAGCPVSTWPDLAPEVIEDSGRHREALKLRRRLLMLPVHLDMNVSALCACLSS